MSYSYPHGSRTPLGNHHASVSPSPLRNSSNAPSGTPTYTRNSMSAYSSQNNATSYSSPLGTNYGGIGHKRGLSEVARSPTKSSDSLNSRDADFVPRPEGLRSALRPLPQAPNGPAKSTHFRSQSEVRFFDDDACSPPSKTRPQSLVISRSDSVRSPTQDRSRGASPQHVHFAAQPALLDQSNLEGLQKSSTSQLRTLSKYAQNGSEEDFAIQSPEQEVAGLHGRRRLQRSMTTRNNNKSAVTSKFTSGWQSSKWIDQQRQFLQAYEYLCHIGEAKEWIEDILHREIPPVVQLEETLRDGVTLAEVVQALHPERPTRIFRNPKLQFRHSDNIALFFRYLAEVDLPELFRFELVDLYEKKNVPKVIYCIHALSWLLFRNGIVDFRIGNLVGQLQFEDHELEATQKGLDKAGISMPSFSGMSANFGVEPEPEPVETEDERIERELAENEAAIADLQAQIRGSIVRIRLGDTMQDLWDSEDKLIRLQSIIRGDFSRQIAQYRLDMRSFAVRMQSATRGFLVRNQRRQRDQHWKSREAQVVTLQSLVRARKAREETQKARSMMQQHHHTVRDLQAAIRGALSRWSVGDQYHETREAEAGVQELQALMRGMLQRKAHSNKISTMARQKQAITLLQGAARAFTARQRIATTYDTLTRKEPLWLRLEASIRGSAIRNSVEALRQSLKVQSPAIVTLQSAVRAAKARQELHATKRALQSEVQIVIDLQVAIRGSIFRRQHHITLRTLKSHTPALNDLQALTRAFLQRQQTFNLLCEMNTYEDRLVDFQSIARSLLLQRDIGSLLEQLEVEEDSIVAIQAALRGKLVRQRFAEKQRFYKKNMEKVIKIQSFVRGRQQGEAYKSLTSGANPPVGTVKNFVHLLNDSDFDFDEELEFERLRKTVVQHVRQNEMAEQYIDQLDIKIALLVKNKITLDEVVRHQKHFGGHVGSLLNNKEIASKDPFDLKALNKNSRKKLEHYQELFFVLQTQPQYLARLFRRFREQGLAETDSKKTEMLMLGMFGFAQKRREEYYLLKLVGRSIKEEADSCAALQDYLRGNYFWTKLLAAYLRSPRDRKYMRDLFGPLVRESIFDNEGLDLESDPMQIYRSAINNEELRTGQRSLRNPDLPREAAIRDPETRETFIAHLQDLRDIADQFFALLEETLPRMPFGIRYVAQQMYGVLCARYRGEDPQYLLQVVGHWLWKTYLLPALSQPELWGVIDRGLSPIHKRNMNEVGRVVGQVCSGRLFGGENVYLQPLNSWVAESIERVGEIWTNLINVRDAERHFDIDEFNDLFARTKPTLYIKMADIFAIHHLVAADLLALCQTQDDVLVDIVRELGSAKSNEHEMSSVSNNEITLQLNPKFHDVQEPDADIKALFMETKRLILYIIRIQSGANLLEILVKPITTEDDDKWFALLDEEAMNQDQRHARQRSAYAPSIIDSPGSTLLDIGSMSYAEVKSAALENILTLEQRGRVSRHNQYQELLNAIALDIRTKHRRRVQRTRELEGVQATLAQLDSKAAFLDEQLQSYNDYVEQAMITLQNKKGKKRFLMPFTKQYNHERELARSGRTPKFGSFKYSARALADKGVMVDWAGYSEDKWRMINITISSDEVGVFHLEGSTGSLMIPGASASIPLDDLLQAQFDNQQFINLFKTGAGSEGGLRLNVNLFLHLVFKKFYREE